MFLSEEVHDEDKDRKFGKGLMLRERGRNNDISSMSKSSLSGSKEILLEYLGELQLGFEVTLDHLRTYHYVMGNL